MRKIALAMTILMLIPTPVMAEEVKITPVANRNNLISGNCPLIIQSLQKVQKSDSKTRVYLGGIYEKLFTAYILPLNIRLVKENNLDTRFTTTQAVIATGRTKFNREFIDYSQNLELLIAMDCQGDPEGFYDQLKIVREKRQQLFNTTSILNQAFESYLELTKELEKTP